MIIPQKKISAENIKPPTRKLVGKAVDDTISDKNLTKPVATDANITAESMPQNTDMVPTCTSTMNDDLNDSHHELRMHIGEGELVLGKSGDTYIKLNDKGNPNLLCVGSKKSDHFIRQIAKRRSIMLTARDLKEINETLKAYAETELQPVDVYLRVAPYQNGIEIDLGDEEHNIVRITAGNVELVTYGSETLFYRSNATLPFVKPARKDDLKKLKKYLNNIKPELQVLLIGWISYTLAHPKVSTTNYVILALIGGQGTGKSFLCKLIARLTDPSRVGLQILSKNTTDLVIAAQNAHVLFYDNVRQIIEIMSDALCVCSTGGALSKRMLYTDSDQSISTLHTALVLNGIFDFITQSDLAQRSLTIHLLEMAESDRLSERDLEKQLEQDMPEILQGLFELIAEIFKHLPGAKATHPERMIDFVHWLAAMEMIDGADSGTYQLTYSECLKEAQLNSLLENPLAAAVYQFADRLDTLWKGRPSDLLHDLNDRAAFSAQRSADWPKSPESLSRRLKVLSAPLKSQGVFIEFTRGKHRQISIYTTKYRDLF